MSQPRLRPCFCDLYDRLDMLLFFCQHRTTVRVGLVGPPDSDYVSWSGTYLKRCISPTPRYTQPAINQAISRINLMLQRDGIFDFAMDVNNSKIKASYLCMKTGYNLPAFRLPQKKNAPEGAFKGATERGGNCKNQVTRCCGLPAIKHSMLSMS